MNTSDIRKKQITRTSIINIAANILLSAFKALVGLLAGSISVILDAANNLTDALSSIITIVGIKLAKRHPDNKHPFGYGRIEYFSAVIISGIVLAAGAASLIESVKKIIHPDAPNYTAVTLITISVAIAAKILLGRMVKAQGEKYNSDALVASGTEASFDALVSASTLLGAAINLLFKINVDGIIGAVISLFIIKTGIELLIQSINSIMGSRADSEITKEIKQTVSQIDGVLGAFDLVLHNYGPDSAIGAVHIEIPAEMSAHDIHKLTQKIQTVIAEKFHVFLTVGIYAVDETYAKEIKAIKELSFDGVLGTHGIYVDREQKYISFDAVADFTVRDKEKLRREITEKVVAALPGYDVRIKFDVNYSD